MLVASTAAMLRARSPGGSASFLGLVAPLVLGATLGCATPQPLVHLAPVQASTALWVGGRATLVAEQEGIRVATAFDRQDGELLGLRVEVENRTDEPLDVDPAWIWFNRCATPTGASCEPSMAVVNPEQVLAKLEVQRSIETADAANDESVHAGLVILGAVGDLGGRGTVGQTASASAAANASAVRHDTAQAGLGAQQQLWADVALRRNTVFPGRGVGGKVFIPVRLDTRYLWLRVRAGGETFSFPFVQTVIPVNPPTSAGDAHVVRR